MDALRRRADRGHGARGAAGVARFNSDQRKAHRLRAGRGAAATRGRADRLRARRAALVPDNRVRDAHSSGLKGLKTSAQLSLVWYSNTQSVGGPRLLSRSRLVGLFGSISVVVAL